MEEKKLPSISIVIPAFNEEKYLPHTLASIKRQTLTPFEVIVSDNNSTDHTAEIAKEQGYKVVHAHEQGYVFALSEGMKHAKGEVIAVVDADTVLDKHWIEVISQAFSDKNIAGSTGTIRIIGKGIFSTLNNKLYELFLRVNFLIGFPHLVGFNFAVRRSVLEKVGGVDLRYNMGADAEIGLRLKKYGKVVFVPSMSVHPSMRRWDHTVMKTLYEYAKSYIYIFWLRKPPPVKQKVIR